MEAEQREEIEEMEEEKDEKQQEETQQEEEDEDEKAVEECANLALPPSTPCSRGTPYTPQTQSYHCAPP